MSQKHLNSKSGLTLSKPMVTEYPYFDNNSIICAGSSDLGPTVQIAPLPSANDSFQQPRQAGHILPQQPMRPSATAAPRKQAPSRASSTGI